jgi:hypothetical protein
MHTLPSLKGRLLGLLLIGLLGAACSGDVTGSGDKEAAREVRQSVFSETVDVEVDVHDGGDGGRQVELTFTGSSAEPLGIDAVMPADTVRQHLNARAETVARRLKRQYARVDQVEQLEIAFVEKASLGETSVTVGPTFTFTRQELADL